MLKIVEVNYRKPTKNRVLLLFIAGISISILSLILLFNSSAGIGRTGCFIALSNGIKQLNKEHIVDIVRIHCDLRRDRGGMIQTHDQYQFLYQALSEYARTIQ
jgi:protein tyrosine phosphatase